MGSCSPLAAPSFLCKNRKISARLKHIAKKLHISCAKLCVLCVCVASLFLSPFKTNIFKKIVDVIDINLKDVKKSTSSRLLPEL